MNTSAADRSRNRALRHSFLVADAKEFGLAEAIMIHHHRLWILKNRANDRNFHDGRTWTYNSARALSEMLPYLSLKQIQRFMRRLVDNDGVFIKANYNRQKSDRTLSYAFKDETRFLGTLEEGDER